jgi:hypothetical protein
MIDISAVIAEGGGGGVRAKKDYSSVLPALKVLFNGTSRRVGLCMFKIKFGESESRRLPYSASRGVANFPARRVGESPW